MFWGLSRISPAFQLAINSYLVESEVSYPRISVLKQGVHLKIKVWKTRDVL